VLGNVLQDMEMKLRDSWFIGDTTDSYLGVLFFLAGVSAELEWAKAAGSRKQKFGKSRAGFLKLGFIRQHCHTHLSGLSWEIIRPPGLPELAAASVTIRIDPWYMASLHGP
jgi:hypothetical protein